MEKYVHEQGGGGSAAKLILKTLSLTLALPPDIADNNKIYKRTVAKILKII